MLLVGCLEAIMKSSARSRFTYYIGYIIVNFIFCVWGLWSEEPKHVIVSPCVFLCVCT